MNTYQFTSESVSEGHPDKVADSISDLLVDYYLEKDPDSRVAIETLVTTNYVLVAGEVKSTADLPKDKLESLIRERINEIGYHESSEGFSAETVVIESRIHAQSADINMGVDKVGELGAGDQGIMFGYATNETPSYLPMTLDLSHKILKTLATIRKESGEFSWIRPDSKCQVTINYSKTHSPISIDSILLSTQHRVEDLNGNKIDQEYIQNFVNEVLLPRVILNYPNYKDILTDEPFKLLVNPTGQFLIGGPDGDTGVTGRKIIVDTYGGRGAHGGGAFSGKDYTKVDRSAAYAARFIAKTIVSKGWCKRALVQLSYAIGVAEPQSVFIDTYGTEIYGNDTSMDGAKLIDDFIKSLDLTPQGIVDRFDLKRVKYSSTTNYGHFGKDHLPWERV